MKPILRTTPARRDPGKRSALGRVLRGALYLKLGIVLLVVIGLGLLYLRLSAGPMSFGRLPERVADAIAARIGPGWTVTLRNTALELHGGSPALRANGLDIRGPGGDLVLRAPYATVSVDGLSLLIGNLQPKSVEFRDPQLRLLVNRDGSLTFSPVPSEAGDASAAAAQPVPTSSSEPSPKRDFNGPSQVSGAVGSLFEFVVGPKSILQSLGRAQLTNASLVFIDADQRERGRFTRVDATFDWTEKGGRHFEATLDGPQGDWQVSGDAEADGKGGYHATVIADSAPIQDILLITGLSAIPATTDLDFSGRVDAAFADGRVIELKARLDGNAGSIRIDDPDTSPLAIEGAQILVAWDEASKSLDLQNLELKGGGTHVRLQGRLATPSETESWKLSLKGKDAMLSPASTADKPVSVSDIAAEFAGPDGVTIKSLSLRGPDLSLDITGQLGGAADPRSLNLAVHSEKTDMRSVLRIWPEAVAPSVRKFLMRSLKSGMLESIALKVGLTGADLAKAVSGEPIPDDALKIDFAISQGVLRVSEALPPLSRLDVSGTVTGTKAFLRAPVGRVDMNERSLNASDGTFILDNYWKDDALARIDFRLFGGADGLGALLQTPAIKQIAGFDLDPAAMKGKTDLKVGIGLAVNHVPAFADLPLTVNGTTSDLSVDKVFGKDRLEGANLAIVYDRGNLSIKGDGKLAGGPATIDVQQTPQGGEANISLVLDDAARAKKGLSFGSQLTGVLPLRVSMPLGKSAKPGMRVETDLTKVAVDQLIPGWVKPAGKPGKLSFTLISGPSDELRDLQLDAGVVQLRGTATLSSDGALDKADLSTFKISAGDEMRAQLERVNGAYKVTVRGNVGDARPFTKLGGSSSAAPARGSASQRDSKDFDLDLALNILTGFNDEAITNASLKMSMRKDSIRQLDMKGRLGASNIAAKTLSQSAGNPVIVLQAEDGGALLRFLDIYRRMSGGELLVQIATGDGPQAGILTLHDFTLNNEPALRRIIPTQSQLVSGLDRSGNAQAVRVDVNEVTFAKARFDFTKAAGRLEFKDAAIFGSQIGFTLGGSIDYWRDRLDISGTFVPAYGLNNAFAQVPLVGRLLGGGQYEGLFAVNFRVVGPMASPTLTVNPLSAVAPGFLRKLFGVGGGEVQTSPAPAAPER
ncbi:DUF3971 domain-containing protein [Microvirga terricola]|uniref:DUF3971 domain-containing protein n=1 Tax=Microvirga terricola TaxID=2719797 RepID=A0ABX0VGV6_9HYPH|nr:DUF3971 domain-containing protein [Microvirga terricola]NIX77397.1 DUF3971 domain-containing protein [Microvirga terricola]